MRILLFLLVAANIGYFAWYNYSRPAAPAPALSSTTTAAKLPGLTLLAEVPASQPDNKAADTGLSDAGGELMLLGGFFEQESADALKQRLFGLGIDGQLVQQEKPAEREYWVYLPPLSSRTATLRLLKELQARKLDGFLIAQGELANGISMGIFPHESLAEEVMQRLQESGYQARIKTVSRKQAVYWFEVASRSEQLIDERTLQLLLKDFPAMQFTQGVAPSN